MGTMYVYNLPSQYFYLFIYSYVFVFVFVKQGNISVKIDTTKECVDDGTSDRVSVGISDVTAVRMC
jgi:hypothetical protein